MNDANVVPLGPLEKRATRTISNAALYDLVQDVAHAVDRYEVRFDQLQHRLDHIEGLLQQMVEKLYAR